MFLFVEPIDPNNVGFMGFINLSEAENPDPYAVANPKRKKMSEYDQNYILKLRMAHADDYKMMQRDLKLNFNQHSEHQLQKMVEKYESLPEYQKIKTV